MRQFLSFILFSMVLFSSGCTFNKNNDNTIYIPGRQFKFSILYINEDGTIRKVDPLELAVTDGFYPQRKQTAINWTHYQTDGMDTLIVNETTGVVDSESQFFIHPPREGDLHILSFAEFPAINTFAFKDSTSTLKSSGAVTMAKSYKGKTITKVHTTQEYRGKTTVSLPTGKALRAHHLVARATSELGSIHGNYYFSEVFGFVRMDYDLPDNTQVSIRLTETNFNSENK